MFGLDKSGRELDRDFLSPIVKILFALAWLGAAAIVFLRTGSERVDLTVVESSTVFGCYRAEGQDPVVLDADGFSIPDQGVGPVPFRVIREKSGAVVYFDEPVSFSVQDERLVFAMEGPNRTRRFDLYSRVGGAFVPDYNGEPVAGFYLYSPGGDIDYRSGPLGSC